MRGGDRVRTFGVEEELLLVDAGSRRPLAAGEAAVARAAHLAERIAPEHSLTVELQQEQLEVVGPPCLTLDEQLAAVRAGRRLADAAARSAGGRVVALASPVSDGLPHLVPKDRYRQIQQHGGLMALDQLTCGFHVHVAVGDRTEGVAVLDRIRVWLPVLLALSANSPFWYGAESGFASYRYQAWSRWPTAGPSEIYGSAEYYDRQASAVLRSGAPLDDGMLYYDARLSARFPTVEVRVADVCLEPHHAAVLAALVRALVEAAARQWQAGVAPVQASQTQLQAWSWWASRFGVDGDLVSPSTGAPAPAASVVAELLDLVQPVLAEHGEEEEVRLVVAEIVTAGSGARRQREAFERRGDLGDVVDAAIHASMPAPPAAARDADEPERRAG
jgi:carboxylate-amine ligase